MSSAQTMSETTRAFTPATVDLKLEVAIIPVADVDRSKQFYQRLGWRLDADFGFDNGFRVVQLTPPGSGCSIQFGTKLTNASPGSVQDMYLVVADVETARAELIARGAEVSDVFHPTAPGGQFQPNGTDGRAGGRGPSDGSYRTFATFKDPDGNGWLIQEVKTRLPGRGLSNLDIPSLTELLREAENQHGVYEPTAPKHHWSAYYAGYIVAREMGQTPGEAAKAAVRNVEGDAA